MSWKYASMTQPDPLAEEVGINAVATIFTNDFKWAFRRQPTLDWGIDAHVETVERDEPTGKLIALQIKSGKSWFRQRADKNYTYYGEERHRRYWTNHSLPVFIVIHDPESKLTLWQKFDPTIVKEGEKPGNWSIIIPASNTLEPKFTECFKAGIQSGEVAYRRFMLTLDYPIIAACLQYRKQGGELSVFVDEWVNKSLNMRGAQLFLESGPQGNVSFKFDRWMSHSSIDEFMAESFPWLDYEYREEAPNGDGSEEVETHELSVDINTLGKAVVEYEQFVEDGGPASEKGSEGADFMPIDNDDSE